jgi:hypothetical protein
MMAKVKIGVSKNGMTNATQKQQKNAVCLAFCCPHPQACDPTRAVRATSLARTWRT